MLSTRRELGTIDNTSLTMEAGQHQAGTDKSVSPTQSHTRLCVCRGGGGMNHCQDPGTKNDAPEVTVVTPGDHSRHRTAGDPATHPAECVEGLELLVVLGDGPGGDAQLAGALRRDRHQLALQLGGQLQLLLLDRKRGGIVSTRWNTEHTGLKPVYARAEHVTDQMGKGTESHSNATNMVLRVRG